MVPPVRVPLLGDNSNEVYEVVSFKKPALAPATPPVSILARTAWYVVLTASKGLNKSQSKEPPLVPLKPTGVKYA
jgi:hypothetical protein